MSVRACVDLFGIFETAIGERGILLAVELIADGEAGGEPAGKIGTDRSTRRLGNIHRTVANIEGRKRIARFGIPGLLEAVRLLGKRPNVVLGNQAVGRVVSPAAIAGGRGGVAFPVIVPVLGVVHLVGKILLGMTPHLQEPLDAELCLGAEV